MSTVVGGYAGFADGVGTLAMFRSLNAISMTPDGSRAVIVRACGVFAVYCARAHLLHALLAARLQAEELSDAVRLLEVATATVTTIAGSGLPNFGGRGFADGTGTSAKFCGPRSIVIHPKGLLAFVVSCCMPCCNVCS